MKVFIVSRKSILAAALVVCMAAVLILAVAKLVPATAEAMSSNRKLPVYCVDRGDEKVVSLTFDAAWGNEDTSTLINILNKYNVHATFFVVGQWVDKYPQSVKQLSDNGEEVMNHSNTHPHMTKLSGNGMLGEITACDDKIKKITGKSPVLFRAPFGDYNSSLVETLESSGHYCIQWDVDTLAINIM